MNIKKIIFVFFSAILIFSASTVLFSGVSSAAYSVSKAQAYAKQYYKNPNPAYPFLSNDCTNFVSQILVAGGITQNIPSTPRNFGINLGHTNYWYGGLYTKGKIRDYSSSPTFTSVSHFNNYWSSRKTTYVNSNINNVINYAKAGDIIIMQHTKRSEYSHAMFVYKKENSTLKLSGHSQARLDLDIKTLTDYKKFKVFRF